ncbi:TPA: hypothetical protein HA244_05770 [Candidatus Micrarchaeota archaeon]|nr:hypothetical protein [Candidatus Micrarchaeota archaeon]
MLKLISKVFQPIAFPVGQSRGQIEMSVLTRFAMVFFIMALAAIMLMFSNREQRGLCTTQAELNAQQIASSINQVLTSPSEDERLVIPIVAALSVGERDRARYTVTITKRPSQKIFSIGVSTESKDCSGFQSVGYGQMEEGNIFFQSRLNTPAHVVIETFGGESLDMLKLTPSLPTDRTSYLIVLKCKHKTFNGAEYLYLQNCNYAPPGETSVSPEQCLKLDNADIDKPEACGFPP